MNIVNLNKQRYQRINEIILNNVKEQYKKQVDYLKTLPNPPQRSEEWFKLRSNKITASMLAPLLKIGRYGSRREVIGEKSGCLNSSFKGNSYTHWGTDFEDEAVKVYQKLFNTQIREFSLIEHPKYSFLGASPDGISDDGIMLEIKCPSRRVITGFVPDYYDCQMQLQMEACDLEVCDFLECLFVKYASEQEYLADNDFTVQMNGFSDLDGEFKRVHCNDFMDSNTGHTIFKGTREKSQYEIGVDIDQGVSPEEVHKIVYWKLERISCVRVARDRDWFAKVLPELEKAWNEIEYYRKHPEEFEKVYPAKKSIITSIYDLETGESTTEKEIRNKEAREFAELI